MSKVNTFYGLLSLTLLTVIRCKTLFVCFNNLFTPTLISWESMNCSMQGIIDTFEVRCSEDPGILGVSLSLISSCLLYGEPELTSSNALACFVQNLKKTQEGASDGGASGCSAFWLVWLLK